MARKPKKTPTVIDPNKIKVRDRLLTRLILGATKGGPQQDRRKEANKKACRTKTHEDQ